MSDLIDRQATIDTFMKATSDGDKADWCAYVLKQLPSAQPKASLIWQPVYRWFRCGACKKIYPNALMKYFNTCEYQPKFNFCPHCGTYFERIDHEQY